MSYQLVSCWGLTTVLQLLLACCKFVFRENWVNLGDPNTFKYSTIITKGPHVKQGRRNKQAKGLPKLPNKMGNLPEKATFRRLCLVWSKFCAWPTEQTFQQILVKMNLGFQVESFAQKIF